MNCYSEAALENHLIEPDSLEARISVPTKDLVVVDMRGSVVTQSDGDGSQTAEYKGSRAEYLQSHIPGAVYIDWTADIADTEDPIPAQVADAGKISELFGRLGIGDSTRIVAYDAHPAMQFATRLWWVCRYFGNQNVRVLHGGWQRWVSEGRPVTTAVPQYEPGRFTAEPDGSWIADSTDVLEALTDSSVQIVDARDSGQFCGAIRRGRRGGHVPGALNVPRELLFTTTGSLRAPDELRGILETAGILPASSDRRTIAYCNGGIAATSVLFALSILGYTNLTNYDGSWNEWNLNEALPVE